MLRCCDVMRANLFLLASLCLYVYLVHLAGITIGTFNIPKQKLGTWMLFYEDMHTFVAGKGRLLDGAHLSSAELGGEKRFLFFLWIVWDFSKEPSNASYPERSGRAYPFLDFHGCCSEKEGSYWQYVAYGKGVADIVFLIIESFKPALVKQWGPMMLSYYYAKLHKYGVNDYSPETFARDTVVAACHFPFFVAMWFETTPNEDLIDVNFPFFFLQRYVAFLEDRRDIIQNFLATCMSEMSRRFWPFLTQLTTSFLLSVMSICVHGKYKDVPRKQGQGGLLNEKQMERCFVDCLASRQQSAFKHFAFASVFLLKGCELEPWSLGLA